MCVCVCVCILYIKICYSFNIHSRCLSVNVITEYLKLVLFTNAQTFVLSEFKGIFRGA